MRSSSRATLSRVSRSQRFSRKWRAQARHRLEIAEPAMLLVMGAVVGLLVSSLILPIFQLSRAVG